MSQLLNQKCVPCEGGTKPFNQEEIQKHLAELNGSWEVLENKKISRKFKFKDFKEAMEFVNKVAEIAEQEGHHPDIAIHYNRVEIALWTHAIGGLSLNDFILAAKIGQVHE